MRQDVIFARMTPEEQARELARLDYEATVKESAERLEYEVRFAEMVFKALVLVNGGAMVALFSLVGALANRNSAQVVLMPHRLWMAFFSFSIGIIATLASGVCAYFTQNQFHETTTVQSWRFQAQMLGKESPSDWADRVVNSHRKGNRFLVIAVLAVLVACGGFVAGCGAALFAVLPR